MVLVEVRTDTSLNLSRHRDLDFACRMNEFELLLELLGTEILAE